MRPSNLKNGSLVNEKGLAHETSYIKDKQSKELIHPPVTVLFGEQAPGPKCSDGSSGVFVSRQSFGCRQWETFTERMFRTWIDRSFPESIENGEYGYWLPSKFPPTDHSVWPAIRQKLVEQGWTLRNAAEQGRASLT